MAFKKCKNDGCEIQIEVRNTAEGWRPFEESGNMHQCQHSEYAKKQKAAGFHVQDRQEEQQKNDHGNELTESRQNNAWKTSNVGTNTLSEQEKLGYVDHTLAAKGHFRAFVSATVEELNEVANRWLEVQNVRFKQWGQLQMIADKFAIALYYEEIKQ